MKIGDFNIEGSSVSAFASFIGIKEMDILLDIGHCPPHFTRYNNVLITHGHQDHLLSISRYIGLRNMNHLPPATIFLPAGQLDNVVQLLSLWSKIENRREYDVNLISVEPDKRYDINKHYHFKSFKTQHSFDSLGYALYEKRKKLKPEYLGLGGKDLVELKQAGKEIDYTLHIPQICYTGDTTDEIFDNEEVKKSRCLIIESTFLSDDHVDISTNRAHLHLESIIDYCRSANNEFIILTHFSMRYMKKEVVQIISDTFGELFGQKVFIL